MQVDFYHLTGAPVERVLPRLAERVLETGGRLLVVSADTELLDRLDSHFWSYRPESFLPHGKAGADGAEAQPILLSPDFAAVNGARNVALADGVWDDAALTFDRAFLLFGWERIEEARAVWRALKDREELERRFWKQDEEGRWTREA